MSNLSPDLLLPYQQAWCADTSPVKVCEKSRRVGLSWCEAADDVLLAATEGKDGMDVWYIGYNQDMAAEYINDCASWVEVYQKSAQAMEEVLVEDEDKQILAFRIRFDSGHRITALSSRPSNLRGKQGKVVIDEAAFHEQLGELLKAAIALLMWGGRVCVISTHNGEDNPFNELLTEVRAGKKPYSVHRITLDDALEQGLYRRICTRLDRPWSSEGEQKWRQELVDFYGEFADEELFCIPSKGSGIYLPRNLIEACMDETIPVVRWSCKSEFAQWGEHQRFDAAQKWCEENLRVILENLDPNRPTCFGEDFGRYGDLTVIAPMQEQPKLAYRCICQVELRNVPFEQQRQVLFYLADRLPRFRHGALDARGNGMYLAEVAMQRYGVTRISQIMLTQPWYIEQMPKFKAAFEDRKIAIAQDPDIMDDLRAIKMENGIAKVPDGYRGKGRDGGKRHGDAAIALAIAWYASQMQGGPIEFKSSGERRIASNMENY